MTSPEPIILVCVPATAPLCVEGATFDQVCSQCRQNVMLAPSGQRFLKEHPASSILCRQCYCPEPSDLPCGLTATSPGELRAEIASIRPNTWRHRN